MLEILEIELPYNFKVLNISFMNKKSIFLVLIFFAFTSIKAFSQCSSDECIAKLGEGYTFLKTYKMESVGEETEHSYVFSKETSYMLVLCGKDGVSPNVTVTPYDSNRKEIATNYDKKNNKYFNAIVYTSKATGMYYLRYSFQGEQPCCVSVLAFKK